MIKLTLNVDEAVVVSTPDAVHTITVTHTEDGLKMYERVSQGSTPLVELKARGYIPTPNEQMAEIFSADGPKRNTIELRTPTPEQTIALNAALKNHVQIPHMQYVSEYDYKDHAKGLHTLLRNVHDELAGMAGSVGLRHRIRKGLEYNRGKLFDVASTAPDSPAADKLMDKATHERLMREYETIRQQLLTRRMPAPTPDFKAIADELYSALDRAQELLSRTADRVNYFENTDYAGKIALILERHYADVKDK